MERIEGSRREKKRKESERDCEIRTGGCGTRWEEWHASSAVYCHGPSGEPFRAQGGFLPRTSAGRGPQRGRGNKQDNWQYIQHRMACIYGVHTPYIYRNYGRLGVKVDDYARGCALCLSPGECKSTYISIRPIKPCIVSRLNRFGRP